MAQEKPRGRPPNKKDNTMAYLKISSILFLFFIFIVIFIVRFGSDQFIDDSISNMYLGIVLGFIGFTLVTYAKSCFSKKK